MRRMPLSAETAVKLAEYMKVPLEHLMHMPQHVLLQKLAEMAKSEANERLDDSDGNIQKNE
ncbi:YycC family protein [Paenibacillaceae bacterium WGS1546]|uniref:YycC family protein n=1 Tax=Cohnella sp. WGS1546 TaxID=3366810 RepID=UPI00372D773D